ncbi:hypothetical protein SAMN05216503_1972 [Polaribacter sp. KT25b]|nr:hypothetical protein SAMN05216503_1972 [Polaribacter sp. KT25b]
MKNLFFISTIATLFNSCNKDDSEIIIEERKYVINSLTQIKGILIPIDVVFQKFNKCENEN